MNKKRKKAYVEARERDEGLCRICGAPAGEIHHIVFRSHSGADVPQNLICLCLKHHREAHDNEKPMRALFIELQEELYGESISIEELKK